MAFNKSAFEAGIMTKLQEIAKEFMAIMARRVDQNNLPKAINENTSAESPQKQGGTYFIDVIIDTSPNKAPMAGAYEWGSGLQDTKGERKKYRIEPKSGGGVLAFPAERTFLLQRMGQSLIPKQSDTYFFAYVDHPGVAPRPYIRPSINDIKEPLKKKFAEEFKRHYLAGRPKVTIIDAKK